MVSNRLDGEAPVVRRESTIPTTITLIASITAGGLLLFTWLAILVVFFLRRKHRREIAKLKDSEAANVAKQTAIPLRQIECPEKCLSERSFINPLPQSAAMTMPKEWLEDDSMMDAPPISKAKARKLPQKDMFQISRDSWPLAGAMPNVSLRLLHPNSSQVTLNQVGGEGYVLPTEPKWPGSTHTRNSLKSSAKIVVSVEKPHLQHFSTTSSDRLAALNRPRHDRRSASENQLSTILRSTSQRLKSAHQKSQSQTLTTFGQIPGPPPTDKLKTPCKPASESQEGLIESDGIESVASSICDQFSSPGRKDARSSGIGPHKGRSSVTLSVESAESLCAGSTPDLVIPAALRSPDKKGPGSPQRHAMMISSASAWDPSVIGNKDGQTSALELGAQRTSDEQAAITSPHRISLANDPFYSDIKIGKRAMPQNRIGGPRPLYMRKTTFGQELTGKRSANPVSSSSSPLRRISGNAQSPPRPDSAASLVPSEPKSNPFSWTPQETVATNTLSNVARPSSRKKGHKRNHLVRISLVPPPPSVCPVPEEEDNVSPPRFSIPLNVPLRAFEPTKSRSPRPSSTSSLRISARPPSISTFNPVLSSSRLVGDILVPADRSRALGQDGPPQIYSPTVAVANYYSDGTSEDEFFNPKPARALPTAKTHTKHHTISHFPHPEHKELFSVTPLAIASKFNPRASLPPRRPSSSASTAATVLTSPPSVPASSILTQPSLTPSHPQSPHTDIPKSRTSTNPTLLNRPRESILHQSICLLRRMNSEVSRSSIISSFSSGEEDSRNSPRSSLKPSPELGSRKWGRKARQSKGSHAYLSMGMSVSPRRSRIGKRPSTRDRVADRLKIKEEDEDGLVKWERQGLANVRRECPASSPSSSSPDPTAEQVKLDPVEATAFKVPALNLTKVAGTAQGLPPRKESLPVKLVTPTSPSQGLALKPVRWSDATPTPSIRVIRHESQLLEPVPKSLPAWGWSKGNGKQEVEGVENVKENMVVGREGKKKDYGNWNGNHGRPDSLGLYDSKGFLRHSPERSGVPEL